MPLHDWTRVDANDYHAFHQAWLTSLWRSLNHGVLPPGYYAMTDQSSPPIKPDVLTLQTRPPATTTGPRGTALLLADTPPRVRFAGDGRAKRPPRAVPEIRVRHNSNNRLVAVIELLSPANTGSRRDLRQFLTKMTGLLWQGVNLMVVDPFPPGPRTPDGIHALIWHEMTRQEFRLPPEQPLTMASYVAQGASRFASYVETVSVGDVLPDMPLFLDPDRYVNVPLEATYQDTWTGYPDELRPLLEQPA